MTFKTMSDSREVWQVAGLFFFFFPKPSERKKLKQDNVQDSPIAKTIQQQISLETVMSGNWTDTSELCETERWVRTLQSLLKFIFKICMFYWNSGWLCYFPGPIPFYVTFLFFENSIHRYNVIWLYSSAAVPFQLLLHPPSTTSLSNS